MPAARRIGWHLLLVLLVALLSAAGVPQKTDPLAELRTQGVSKLMSPVAPPRIGVMTMEPGEEFWERFGHDSIVVFDPSTGIATSFNFGFFDMTEPDFVGNFVRGVMRYYLIALPADEDIADYRAKGRGVSIQWLDLDDDQALSLANALVINARPENARYRYEYFTDNCATRVRDALDRALGGTLKEQLSGRSQGNTFRSESVRLAWPAKWMAFGFHVGLSGYADRPLSRWDEAFIPMRLRDSLREVKRADGQPLVASENILVPHRLPLPPEEMPSWRVPAMFVGLLAAMAAYWVGRRRPRLLAAFALPFWTLSGIIGVVMLYLWFGTAHIAGHGNENLLLLSPLCLLLLPGGWQALRGRDGSSRFRTLLWIVAGSAAIAGFLKFLPFRPQENVEWVLLLLPLHLALAKVYSPKV
jgi:hypothetical protein